VIPSTCPCCEVLQPPHEGDCTFHADAPGDAATFDEVSALRAEIARLREERRWISVGERLPELNEANRFQVRCLVWCKYGGVCEMTYEINTYAKQERNRQPRWKWQGLIDRSEVTHWQPLPLGPEAAP
jgi:Protein of unknown function (DUF551)